MTKLLSETSRGADQRQADGFGWMRQLRCQRPGCGEGPGKKRPGRHLIQGWTSVARGPLATDTIHAGDHRRRLLLRVRRITPSTGSATTQDLKRNESRREPLRQGVERRCYTAPNILTATAYQNAGKIVKLNLIYPHCRVTGHLPRVTGRAVSSGGGCE